MSDQERLHALDAVRAFALLLGILFHAGFSFLPGLPPGIWAINDSSQSLSLALLLFVSHIFRMSLFFFLAGFFARLLFHRRGAHGFWANRAKRILVPLIVGWVILFPSIALVWGWGLSITFAGAPAPATPPQMPEGWFPLTHLWFLYYLLLLYVLVISVRSAIAIADRDRRLRAAADGVMRVLVRSGAAALVLGFPLAAALYFQRPWYPWAGIPTPDMTLVPQPLALLAYGTAFAFGWLLHRQKELLSIFARRWPLHLAGALLATGVCISIQGVGFSLVPAAPGRDTAIYAVSYCIALWCWVFAITGIGLRFLSEESAVRRYIADSSYWLYLVHLPVVAAFQVLVARLDWHWSLKYPLIVAASFAVLFASYHYLVRSTFIGETLNGRRYPRSARKAGSAETPVRAGNAGDGELLAELRGVRKSYGSKLALDGLDLQVRRGELLALLGPNGAGKSTAIGIWLGLLQPDAGEVRLMGRSPLDVESRREIGVMMQEVQLEQGLRVRELIQLTSSYYPNPLSVEEVLRLTRTRAIADRPYAKLSAGQKRQAQFAVAVCGQPRLLFLDEPTVGLDVPAREGMWATIRELIARGCSIVLTTHYLEEAEMLADRVAVIANGRLIAQGTVDEVRAVVDRKRISCSTELQPEQVLQWPDVVAATRDNRKLQITAVHAESVVRRLLAEDANVRDLEVRQAGLAEAFTKLTLESA